MSRIVANPAMVRILVVIQDVLLVDFFFVFGRVRFQLKDEKGSLLNEGIRNKNQLADRLGALVLADRASNPSAAKQQSQGKRSK